MMIVKNEFGASITWAIIFTLASTCVFLLFVSLENFGSLLPPDIDENGFLSLHKFLTHYTLALIFCLAALSTAFALIIIVFSRTSLGRTATKAFVGLSSISVSTLVSWIGRTSEFANGQLFRSATESYADPIRMFVFVASISVAFTFIFVLMLFALKELKLRVATK
jgi:hypothetical protein